MRWLRRESGLAGACRFAGWLGLLGIAVATAGCASSSAGEKYAAGTAAQPRRIELEADGLPAQVAPPMRRLREPDDPSEPFSPNYGPRPVHRAVASAPMSNAEADALIARAIAEHEMRRP